MSSRHLLTSRFIRRSSFAERLDLFRALSRVKFLESDYPSFLGFAWSLINPLIMVVTLYLVFNHRFGSEVPVYPLYLLIGVSCVTFFTTGSAYLMQVFQVNRELLLNTRVPPFLLVLSEISLHGSRFLVELVICGFLAAWYGLSFGKILLHLPLLGVLTLAYAALIMGAGLLLSFGFALARDVRHIWNLVSRAFLFVTPVFFPIEIVKGGSRFVVEYLNPLTPFVSQFRALLMPDESMDPAILLRAVALGIGVLVAGLYAARLGRTIMLGK